MRRPPSCLSLRAPAALLLLGLLTLAVLTGAAPKPVKGKAVTPKGEPRTRTAPTTPARGFAGHWEGAMVLFGNPIEIRVDASGPNDTLRATMDIPSQGVTALPLHDVRARGDSVLFLLKVPGTEASFAGVQRVDSITGTFRQAGISAPFHLERGAAIVRKPEPAVPYERQEVTITSGDVTLAGTLTRPKGRGPFPGVLLISGSGAQNRDEEVFGFKPFALIADHLSRRGFAVLRVDDRGVGGSTGEFAQASSLEFADDARASLRLLRSHRNVNRRRVGIIGHSEGGLIGPMVAATPPDSVAFLAMLGPPGMRGDSLLVLQGTLIFEAMGASDSLRLLNRNAQRLLITAAQTGQGWDEARTATRAVLRYAYASGGVTLDDSTLTRAVEQQVTMMSGPWMRHFLTTDPTEAMTKVRCPVLVLFGEHDLQVPPDANRPPIERAFARAGNRDVTVRVLPRANHLFQETDNGNPALYGSLAKAFVPGMLDTLSGWMRVRTRR